MKHSPLGPLVVGLGLLFSLPLASAQTATWTGGSALTTKLDWNDTANWDTGVVPNSPTDVAVINNTAVATSFPGGGVSISSSTVDLAELRLGTSVASGSDTWAQRVLVTAPYALPPVGSTLNLHGAGITTANSTGADPRYIVSVGMGSSLHFYNSATISGTNVIIGMDSPYAGFFGGVEFHDQASAGNATISMYGSGSGAVTFHDQSTAANAAIRSDDLTFADHSSAGNARLSTYAYGETIYFRDQANAAHASINLTRYGGVVLSGQASGGHATVTCSLESSGVKVLDQADVSGLSVKSSRDTAGRITGAGVLDISGAAGNVTIGGLDGSVRVYLGANTLTLEPSAADQMLSGGIAGTGGLVLDTGRVVTVALSNIFSPSENTYTGPTVVRSGTLNLVNSRLASTTINVGARLTGAGTVAGNLINSGAILPGNSTGTFTVTGNFVQNPTGVLGIEINSPTDFDRLAVSGSATLTGTLNLTGTGGLAPVGNVTIPFLSAGTLSGRFDIVTPGLGVVPGLGAMRTAQLVYSATGVSYQVTQAAFAGFGGTSPAATALGAHLDATLAGATGVYRDLLAGLNSLSAASQVTAGLEALAPDRYSVLAENAFATASARRAATDHRLATTRSSASGDSALFFEAGIRSAVFDATGPDPEGSSHLDHGTVGGIWRQEAVSLGAALTYETGNVDLDQGGSTDRLRSITPELFIQYDAGRFFLNASITRSGDNHDLRRRIVYPGFDQTATASTSGSRLDLGVTAGFPFTTGDWTITPLGGLLGSTFKVNDFVESSAMGANLAISGWTNHSLRSHFGVEATRTAGKITPRLAVRWLHEYKDDRSLEARLAAVGTSYTAPGRRAETDLVEVSLAVSGRLGKNATGYLSLGSTWGRRSHLTADLSAGVNWQF